MDAKEERARLWALVKLQRDLLAGYASLVERLTKEIAQSKGDQDGRTDVR